MQYWLLETTTPTTRSPLETESQSEDSSDSTTSQPSSTQNPVEQPFKVDPISSLIVPALLAIVGTLLWKWREAEVRRLEGEKKSEIDLIRVRKDGEVKLLEEKYSRELSEKNNEIKNLIAEVKLLERRQEDFQELNSIFPQKFLQETKGTLEMIIKELESRIKILERDKETINQENEELQKKLADKLSNFKKNLQQVSAFERYLSERSISIHKAILWIEGNKVRLAKESCELLLQRSEQTTVEPSGRLRQWMPQFSADIEDYLSIIGDCLRIGRPDLLDRAKAEISAVVDLKFYVEVFKIIRDEKAPLELPDKESERESEIYFNYLIELFENVVT